MHQNLVGQLTILCCVQVQIFILSQPFGNRISAFFPSLFLGYCHVFHPVNHRVDNNTLISLNLIIIAASLNELLQIILPKKFLCWILSFKSLACTIILALEGGDPIFKNYSMKLTKCNNTVSVCTVVIEITNFLAVVLIQQSSWENVEDVFHTTGVTLWRLCPMQWNNNVITERVIKK